MKKITAPVPGLNGQGVGGIEFKDSVALTDNYSVIAYCEAAGYTVEDADDVQVGTDLRDAAVDPHAGDHLPPVNAGEADPHGPSVVSPDLDGHTPPVQDVPPVPAGNATREEWADYVTAIGGDPGDLGRDALRDAFGGQG